MIEEDKIKKRLAKAPVFRKIKKKRDQVKHREGTREDYPPIHLNEPERNAKKENRFPSNVITTSKYTLWSFIPLVLWSQYRRATTIYFTLIFAITAIPAYTVLLLLHSRACRSVVRVRLCVCGGTCASAETKECH
jgi:hypothetical protein